MRINSSARLAAILAICLGSLAASADVLKIVVDDTIHPLISEHIDRAIQEAQRTHAAALLIELRTPGGLLSSTQEIVQKILASQVPVIIFSGTFTLSEMVVALVDGFISTSDEPGALLDKVAEVLAPRRNSRAS